MRSARKHRTELSALPVAVAAAAGMFVLATSGPALATGNGAGIVGSPHDFSAEAWNFRGEICRVCHIPHDVENDLKLFENGLLWNHQLSSATYTMYDASFSPTLQNTQSAQPDGTAKLCLGCHDGTVAIDQFDKNADGSIQNLSGPIQAIDADAQIGRFVLPDGTRDLRGTHPISIVYDETVDTSLNPKTDTIGTSGTIADVLDNGKVQCSTCHDVHDQEAVAGTHLLRVSTTSPPSGLCLTCHIK